MKKSEDTGRYALGTALMSGGLIAASPVDELACVVTGPFAPVCISIAAAVSTPVGLLAAGVGIYLMATSEAAND